MGLNFSHVDLSKGLSQVKEAVKVLMQTPAFIKKHQLWKGFFDNAWVAFFSVLVAAAFSFILYNNIYDYFNPNEDDIEINIPTKGFEEGIDAIDEVMEDSLDAANPELEKTKQALVKQKEILCKNRQYLKK